MLNFDSAIGDLVDVLPRLLLYELLFMLRMFIHARLVKLLSTFLGIVSSVFAHVMFLATVRIP